MVPFTSLVPFGLQIQQLYDSFVAIGISNVIQFDLPA